VSVRALVRLVPGPHGGAHRAGARHGEIGDDAVLLGPGQRVGGRLGVVVRVAAARRDGGAFPIDFAVFLCEKHNLLADNITFRDNLLNILLY